MTATISLPIAAHLPFDIRHRARLQLRGRFAGRARPPASLAGTNGVNRQVFWRFGKSLAAPPSSLETPFTYLTGSQDFSGFNQFNDRPDVNWDRTASPG